jgi:glycosyltransferase involved in cell wall biosynthesis
VPNVSVYIPAYNVSEFLAACIEALLLQSVKPDEILVINDGSTDSTAEVASLYSQVTLIHHDRNRGLAAARNTAFRTARNDLVASIDADCVAERTWLENLLPQLNDTRVAGVGGRLVEGVRESLADRWRCAHMRQEWGSHPIRNPRFLFGCNNVFRKSAVIEVGGFKEALRTNGEDAELSNRLRATDWELVYEPNALATHRRHDSVSSIMNVYWRWLFYGFPNYSERLKIHNILRHAFLGNVRYMFAGLAWKDVREGRTELLLIDFLLLFYCPYREFREWWKLRSQSRNTHESPSEED